MLELGLGRLDRWTLSPGWETVILGKIRFDDLKVETRRAIRIGNSAARSTEENEDDG